MRAIVNSLLMCLICGVAFAGASAQQQICPGRPQPGSLVVNPLDLFSQNGVLTVDLTLQNEFDSDGFEHYCYVYIYQGQQVEAPTLRLNPGDQLVLNLTNNIQAPYDRYPRKMQMSMHVPGKPGTKATDDCNGGMILQSTTNMHFHGLNVAPVCHQDDVIYTLIQSGDPAFQYSIQIPANDNPGMYWYHPHAHGNATTQLDGGAAGAIFIGGTIQGTQGLPERVFVIRQQFKNPNSWLPGPNQLTVNFQPALFPNAPSPFINVQYGQQEFWRVVNASTQAFLSLQLQFTTGLQQLEVVALDGVPLQTPIYENEIDLPPAGRVEFITPGLPSGQGGTFLTNGYNTGPVGNPNAPQTLIKLVGTDNAKLKVRSTPEPTKPPAGPPALCRIADAIAHHHAQSVLLRADGGQQRAYAVLHHRARSEAARLPHGRSSRHHDHYRVGGRLDHRESLRRSTRLPYPPVALPVDGHQRCSGYES